MGGRSVLFSVMETGTMGFFRFRLHAGKGWAAIGAGWWTYLWHLGLVLDEAEIQTGCT